MATRSTIALEFADGTVQQVYAHWDGYLENNGMILYKHYSDPFKLRDLIDLGDISSLAADIGSQHGFDARDEGTTFYGRDRGETGCAATKFANFEDYKATHQYEEFEYILRLVDGVATWFVSQYGKAYLPLADALAEHLRERAEEETLAA